MRLLILRTSKNKRQGICTNIVRMGKPLHKFGLAMEGNQIVDSNMNQSFWSSVELCLIFIRNTMTY
jgi:hypothetical protein